MTKLPEKYIDDFYKLITQKIIEDVYEKIKENDPSILINFEECYKETTLLINSMKDDFNSLSKKMKKIIDSSSLYDDVYKMRDEIIEIKKMLEKLSNGKV